MSALLEPRPGAWILGLRSLLHLNQIAWRRSRRGGGEEDGGLGWGICRSGLENRMGDFIITVYMMALQVLKLITLPRLFVLSRWHS